MKLSTWILSALLLGSVWSLPAQNADRSLAITLGLASPVLDNGLGPQIGLNPRIPLNDYLALGGQLSYQYLSIQGTFLAGNRGNEQVGQALAGLHLFLLPDRFRVRPYLAVLAGGAIFTENVSGSAAASVVQVGYSLAAYADIDRWLVGIAYEGPGYLLLKVGYRLGDW